MIDATTLYLLCAASLFAVGTYGLIAVKDLLRKIIGLNIAGSGIFLVFITVAYRTPGPIPDPVPHAMVLTGIVVAVCASAVALAMASLVAKDQGQAELDEEVDA